MKATRGTKQKIIEAAAALFVRHGFAGVSMDAIAEAAGFTKVTVYQHVKSKEDLLLDCLRWRLDNREIRLDAYFTGRPATVDTVLEIFLWMSLKNGVGSFHGCAFLKAASGMAALLPAVRTIALEAKRLLRERIKRLTTRAAIGESDTLGEAIALLLEGAQALSLLEQSSRPFEAARALAAEWIRLHQDAQVPVTSVKLKARR